MPTKSEPLTTGARVRNARKTAGLTQAELAERAQTTQDRICRIETDRSDPTLDLLRRIAAVLRCDWRELGGD